MVFLFSNTLATTLNSTTKVRDRESCWLEYEKLRTTSQYPLSPLDQAASSWATCWLPPTTAESYCQTLWLSNPDTLAHLVCKLCVVTGVSPHNAAFYVAQELALCAGMHVVLAGRANLQTSQQAIQDEAKRRGLQCTVYTVQYHLASCESISKAAGFVIRLIQRKYKQTQLTTLLNMAHVGSATAKLTQDGLEYNTGCNAVGTHYFTKLLLPYMACQSARIIYATSMGHCLGTQFNPQRFIQSPKEGGAPPGFIVEARDDEFQVLTPTRALLAPTETIQVNENEANYTPEQHRQAVEKRGTQVGRSKMALVADAFHFSCLHPKIHFFTFHLLPPPSSQSSGSFFSLGSSQNNVEHAAFPALRAALDPTLMANNNNFYYLHSDGNPWTPMEPAQDEAFAQACYEACEAVLHQIGCGQSDVLAKHSVTAAGYQPPQL